MAAISYSVGYTAIDAAETSVTVTPPPLYSAGDLLVMGVIAGGTTDTVVSASTPSGWTALSGDTAPYVFTKTATSSEPTSYTIDLGATATAAVFIAAYPAATVVSSAFHASADNVTSYSPAFPSGITSGETVLLIAAAVSSGTNDGWGGSNFNLPSGAWTTEVPVFGQSLPSNTDSVYPCSLGMADVTGSTSTPALNSPLGCNISAAYLVLDVTGTAPAAPYAVTVTADGPTAKLGLVMTVKALSGAASADDIYNNGAYNYWGAGGTSQAPSLPVTPAASGSYVYGALAENYGVTDVTAYTAASGTTFIQNIADSINSCIYGTFRSTGTTTANATITLGGTAPDNSWTTAAAAEILAAPGSSLAETATVTAAATVPGDFATTTLAVPAYLTSQPAGGTLLVAMVAANSAWGSGNASVTITDTLGLTWYLGAQNQYPSYSGVWFASVPSSHTATAALTVTPSFSASGSAGSVALSRSASLTVTPSFTVATSGGAPVTGNPVLDSAGGGILDSAGGAVFDTSASSGTAQGALTVTPSFTAAGIAAGPRSGSASLTVTLSLTASGAVAGPESRAASLTVTPSLSAAGTGSSSALSRSAALTVTLVFTTTVVASPPETFPAWSAARNGLPGDSTAVNDASQAAQLLAAHGIAAVYQGIPVWPPAETSTGNPFYWMDTSLDLVIHEWLPLYDIDQPFSFSGTAVGRVEVPVLAFGNGADLTVTLCPDNGSGSPNTSAPVASTRIPAAQIVNLTAPAGLAAGPPLATARGNAALLGEYSFSPWSQPAVSLNGAGTYATPVTSSSWTLFLGGYDSVASAASAQVTMVQYLGAGVLSAAIPQASLPQASWDLCAAATTDTLFAAGGTTTAGGLSGAWTASWDPSTGTLGAWSAQQALPAVTVNGAAAAWGTTVYVLGGSTTGAASAATANVWVGSAANGQITAWTAGPPLPQPLLSPYVAVIGNWLVVAGGENTAGTAQTATWHAAINSSGALSGWQQGPSLPQACYAFTPSWNLAVTGNALVIAGGTTTGGDDYSPYAQTLTFTADGPAARWQAQVYGLNTLGITEGVYQCAAFPSAVAGGWDIVGFHLSTYDYATLYPVPMLSVPLPATGLTSGATYHLVFHQDGGDTANNYLQLGQVFTVSGLEWLSSARGSGGPWTANTGAAVACTVFDATAGGPVLHTWEDSGARVTTPVWAGSGGQLLGLCEATAFLDGTMFPAVTQVTYGSTGLPSGLVQLA